MTMDDNYLHTKVTSSEDTVYVEVFPGDHLLASDQDASDLVVLCMEKKVDRMLIHDGVFADSFFSLKHGVAGIFLQKFVNYSITAAIVIGSHGVRGSAFFDMAAEANRGEQIRFFQEEEPAREWITSGSVIPL